MQTNLFFLCGPHGSGKTTLGEELEKVNPRIVIPELYSRNVKFNTDPVYRQALKICSRAIEGFEYLDIARKNLTKLIVGNRCIYDVLAYNWVYKQMGWIDNETFQRSIQYAADFFREDNFQPNAIVLNPGFDVVKRHLEERWKRKGKKWREEDLEYARFACEAYEAFRERKEIFYVDHEIDLHDGVDVKRVNDWILSLEKLAAA